MNDYRQFDLWKEAGKLSVMVHRLVQAYPSEAPDILRSETLRNAYQIPGKIAEGYFRGSEIDLGAYMEYSMRSCSVVDSLLSVASDLGYLTREEFAIAQAQITHFMEQMDSRQPVPWSPVDNGWHYEPEDCEEDDKI